MKMGFNYPSKSQMIREIIDSPLNNGHDYDIDEFELRKDDLDSIKELWLEISDAEHSKYIGESINNKRRNKINEYEEFDQHKFDDSWLTIDVREFPNGKILLEHNTYSNDWNVTLYLDGNEYQNQSLRRAAAKDRFYALIYFFEDVV